jgi:DNA-binding Lrp family transcriptional regulator
MPRRDADHPGCSTDLLRHLSNAGEPSRRRKSHRQHGDDSLYGVPKLDRIDLNILVQLQEDGRMTNANLAEAVGLSASPCLQRVKRLESAGYITGYGAQINLAKLTESISVFTEITLVDHRKEDFVKFEANMRKVDELMECHLVSGGYDYLLRFVCRNISHYQERMENLLERNIGIKKYFSYIVLKSPIVKNALPLKALLDTRNKPEPIVPISATRQSIP